MLDLIIRGGQVVTPQGVGSFDVAVEGETIAAVTAAGTLAATLAAPPAAASTWWSASPPSPALAAPSDRGTAQSPPSPTGSWDTSTGDRSTTVDNFS